MSDLLNQASLVYIPSGYKEDTAYSVIPTDGSGDLTFTRASDGTRVNSSGLVENVPWNLVTYSEDMTTGKVVANLTATNNDAVAPNETNTAATIEATSASGVFIRTSAVTFGAINFSVYFKYDSQQFIQLIHAGDASCYMNFDIQNGIIGNAGAKATNGKIENVGSGWYRCSVYMDSSSNSSVRVYHVDSLTASYASSSTTVGNTYLTWGWQLTQAQPPSPTSPPQTDKMFPV